VSAVRIRPGRRAPAGTPARTPAGTLARTLALSAALALLASLAQPASVRPARADTLRMVLPAAPRSLDPHRYPPDPAAWPVVMLAYKRLFDLKDGTSELSNAASAAATFRVSDDGRIYTIVLQEGQSFSDGTPVDSRAALFSFDRLMASETGRVYFGPLRYLEIVGPHTFRLHLDRPWPPLLAALATPMASLVSPGLAQKPVGFLDTGTLGSGRMEVDSFQGDRLGLRIRLDSPTIPRIDRVEMLFEPDAARRAALVAGGQAHLAWAPAWAGAEPAPPPAALPAEPVPPPEPAAADPGQPPGTAAPAAPEPGQPPESATAATEPGPITESAPAAGPDPCPPPDSAAADPVPPPEPAAADPGPPPEPAPAAAARPAPPAQSSAIPAPAAPPPEPRLLTVPTWETRFLAFNLARPYLKLDAVREALAALALAEFSEPGLIRPAGFFPAGLAPELSQGVLPDPMALRDRAATLLGSTGPSRIPLDLAYRAEDPWGRLDAERLQRALAAHHLPARLVPLAGAHGQGLMEKADWDLLLDWRRPALPSQEMWIGGFLDSRSSIRSNPAGFNDSETDRLIAEMETTDRTERGRVVRRLAIVALSKRPYVMLYQRPAAILADPRLASLAPHPMWPEVWPVEASNLDPFRSGSPAPAEPIGPAGPLIPGFDHPVAEPWE
jgi:ABC-type transport system substrate-binding protein